MPELCRYDTAIYLNNFPLEVRARRKLDESFDPISGSPKRLLRQQLLSACPEAKLRPDIPALMAIIPFNEFRCSPHSSVARDEAVWGSDIDGATVVTKNPTSLREQQTFIYELRREGYEVYHPRELVEIRKNITSFTAPKIFRKTTQWVMFYSQEEMLGLLIDAAHTEVLDMPLAIYLAGFDIKRAWYL